MSTEPVATGSTTIEGTAVVPGVGYACLLYTSDAADE